MESIHVVEDWHRFCEYFLRCHEDANILDPRAVGWPYGLSVSTFAYFEDLGRAECDIMGARESVFVHLESQFGGKVHESEWLDWKSGVWYGCSTLGSHFG